jgi:FAD/FMN-containing dehydrogenase
MLASSLVRVEAGASVTEVNAILAARGKALPTFGAYTHMTIAGALATATHGSGLAEGCMADLTVSADVVAGDGRMLRIEPRDGPTDPGRFSHPDLVLMQDDDVFHSVIAGLGAMGIVHSVTLRACDDEVLEEVREPTTFADAIGRLRSVEWVSAHRDVAMLVSPYEHRARRRASLTRIFATGRRQRGWAAPRHRLGPLLLARLPLAAWAAGMLDVAPDLAPWAIDFALERLDDARYVGPTRRVLGEAAHGGAVAAHAVEAAVPFDDLVPTLEALFGLAESEARRGQYVRAPLTVRFTGASRHFLSPQYGRASATVEVMSLASPRARGAELEPYAELLLSRGGRLHFGLEVGHVIHHRALLGNIPELERWRAVARALDPRGLFIHRLVRETGLRGALEQPRKAA